MLAVSSDAATHPENNDSWSGSQSFLPQRTFSAPETVRFTRGLTLSGSPTGHSSRESGLGEQSVIQTIKSWLCSH